MKIKKNARGKITGESIYKLRQAGKSWDWILAKYLTESDSHKSMKARVLYYKKCAGIDTRGYTHEKPKKDPEFNSMAQSFCLGGVA